MSLSAGLGGLCSMKSHDVMVDLLTTFKNQIKVCELCKRVGQEHITRYRITIPFEIAHAELKQYEDDPEGFIHLLNTKWIEYIRKIQDRLLWTWGLDEVSGSSTADHEHDSITPVE